MQLKDVRFDLSLKSSLRLNSFKLLIIIFKIKK